MRSRRSLSTRSRNCSKPRTFSSVRAPLSVRAGMNQPKMQITAAVRIAGDDPGEMRDARSGSECATEYEEQDSDHDSGADVALANCVRAMEIVAVGHEGVEDAAADGGQMRIEMIL